MKMKMKIENGIFVLFHFSQKKKKLLCTKSCMCTESKSSVNIFVYIYIQCMLESYNSLVRSIVVYICYIVYCHILTHSAGIFSLLRSNILFMNFIRRYFEIIVLLCARDNVQFEHFWLCSRCYSGSVVAVASSSSSSCHIFWALCHI